MCVGFSPFLNSRVSRFLFSRVCGFSHCVIVDIRNVCFRVSVWAGVVVCALLCSCSHPDAMDAVALSMLSPLRIPMGGLLHPLLGGGCTVEKRAELGRRTDHNVTESLHLFILYEHR